MCYWGAVISRPNVQNVHPIKRTVKGTKFDKNKKKIYLDFIREGKGRISAARGWNAGLARVNSIPSLQELAK